MSSFWFKFQNVFLIENFRVNFADIDLILYEIELDLLLKFYLLLWGEMLKIMKIVEFEHHIFGDGEVIEF